MKNTLHYKLLCGIVLCCATASLAGTEENAKRLTPREIAALPAAQAGIATSGVSGLRTTVLYGDPHRAGLYAIRISVPPHTVIKPHHHRDDRVATVIEGTWYIGYGARGDTAALKQLPPGSFYTEPAGQAHFAATADQAAVVYITGFGPSDTVYVNASDDPARAQSAEKADH